MRFDGWVMFALVIVAAMAMMIYEWNRPPPGASAIQAAADGADAQELAALMHAARADTSAIDDNPWYHFPWGINGMRERDFNAGYRQF